MDIALRDSLDGEIEREDRSHALRYESCRTTISRLQSNANPLTADHFLSGLIPHNMICALGVAGPAVEFVPVTRTFGAPDSIVPRKTRETTNPDLLRMLRISSNTILAQLGELSLTKGHKLEADIEATQGSESGNMSDCIRRLRSDGAKDLEDQKCEASLADTTDAYLSEEELN